MDTTIGINQAEKRFVIKSGKIITCLSFETVFARATELARRIKSVAESTSRAKDLTDLIHQGMPLKTQIGTIEQYAHYNDLLLGYQKLGCDRTWFDARTPKTVQDVLESARKFETRIRIFYGDIQTGRDWLEEFDIIGRIGRSTGLLKTPLLLTDDDNCGSELISSNILQIVDLETGIKLYKHPKHFIPKMKLDDAAAYNEPGYTHCVKVESKTGAFETLALCKSLVHAAHWISFMQGAVHDCPQY